MSRTSIALPARASRRTRLLAAAATAAFSMVLVAHATGGPAHHAASGSLNRPPLASGSLNRAIPSGSLN